MINLTLRKNKTLKVDFFFFLNLSQSRFVNILSYNVKGPFLRKYSIIGRIAKGPVNAKRSKKF